MSKRIPICLGLILVIAAIWLFITPSQFVRGLIERLDNLGYDMQLRTRVFTEHLKPQSPVAIVDIDDKSLKAVGRWPWERSDLAKLVGQLQQQGAAVIAFDIFFSEKENNISLELLNKLTKDNLITATLKQKLTQFVPLFDDDSILAKSLTNMPSVLAIGFLPRHQTQNALPPPALTLSLLDQHQLNLINAHGYISNIPLLQNAAKGAGFINIYPDTDGIIRRTPLVIEYQGNVYPTLSLQAVMTYLNENIALITPNYDNTKRLEGIQLGNDIIPTDARGQAFIPFIGKSYTFPYYSAVDVMDGTVPKDTFLGKIVFIGTSATGLGDLQATSIQNPFPGVEIQATLVNGMLQHGFSYKPEWVYGATFLLILSFGLISAISFPYFGPRLLGLIIIFLPPTLLFFNNWIWIRSGLIISFLLPTLLVLLVALLNIIYGYLFETRKREQLKEMFGQYVPAKHIDEMLTSHSNFALRGEDREMSVLFADIRNFTTISEGLAAADLVDMLNTFFTPMTEIIFTHRGTIDKYIGDLIMAFWGAPLKDKNHARHAIQSALDMQKKLKEMHDLIARNNWPTIKLGIGINTGMMSVGDMGSKFRRNYTVLGDTVNLASRVESLSKFYGVDIVVTEYTQKDQPLFIFRKLDRVRVKGKTAGIEIYEVIGLQRDLTPELKQELDLYDKALQDYFAERFDEALRLMNELHVAHPQTKIYNIYIERINEFKSHPLPPNWDGVYVHATK